MSDPFAITLSKLEDHSERTQALFLAVPACLAIAWIIWMFFARVHVYATSDQARVEVADAVYVVQAPLSGRVMKSGLEMGRQVATGDVLVELEADPQKLRVQGEQSQQQSLQDQLDILRNERRSQETAEVAEKGDSQLAADQARASLAEAQENARMADQELKRRQEAYKAGLLSQAELSAYQSDARKKNIELQSAEAAVKRSLRALRIHESEREARMAEIDGDIGRIQGQLAASGNTVKQLQDELGWHQIVAAGGGRLDETVDIKRGSYVREGDKLAVIVPPGQMRIVAQFVPRDAVGRVRPGQSGFLRLDGFPWQQYGSVAVSVKAVSSEVRDGRVRVEMVPQGNPRLPLQHGLPGSVSVEVARVSPASMLLRKAGDYVSRPVADAADSPQNATQAANQ
jgi:multidrug resistance efflux pump